MVEDDTRFAGIVLERTTCAPGIENSHIGAASVHGGFGTDWPGGRWLHRVRHMACYPHRYRHFWTWRGDLGNNPSHAFPSLKSSPISE